MIINDLSSVDKAHWMLHLKYVVKDTPSIKRETDAFLSGSKLPNIKHPSFIHDWLEHPEMRAMIEAWNG